MAIKRVKMSKNYSVVSNRIVRHYGIGFSAIGLYTYMVSLRPDRPITIERISKFSGVGKHAIRSALKLLIDLGVVEKNVTRDRNGRFMSDFLVHQDIKIDIDEDDRDSSDTCVDRVQNSDAENPTYNINTNNINTNPPYIPPKGGISSPLGWEKKVEIFLKTYPQKTHQKIAKRYFKRHMKKGVSFEAIMSGLNHYIQCKPKDFHWSSPASWLRNQRWKDRYNNQSTHRRNHHEARPNDTTEILPSIPQSSLARYIDPRKTKSGNPDALSKCVF